MQDLKNRIDRKMSKKWIKRRKIEQSINENTENKVKKRSKTAEKAKSGIQNLQKMQNYGIIELGRAKKEWMYYFKRTHKILHKRELQTF